MKPELTPSQSRSETRKPLYLWSLIAIALGVTVYGATQIMPTQAQNTAKATRRADSPAASATADHRAAAPDSAGSTGPRFAFARPKSAGHYRRRSRAHQARTNFSKPHQSHHRRHLSVSASQRRGDLELRHDGERQAHRGGDFGSR